MSCLVNSSEGEEAVFTSLAVLGPVHGHRSIAGRAELLRIGVIGCKRDSLSAKPVTCIRAVKRDSM